MPRLMSSSTAGTPGPGMIVGIDAPHAGHVLAGGGVGDHPVAGQLVGLLAVLAAALAVALARDGAVAAALGAHEAERQGQVDDGGDGVGAVDVLLGAAAREQERSPATAVRAGVGQRAGDAAQLGLGDAGRRGDPLGPPLGDAAAYGIDAVDARGEVVVVGERLGEHDVQQAEDEHQVGAGHELHVLAGAVLGELGGGAEPRVDDDQPAALADAAEVLDGRRHGVGEVAAEQHDDLARR